MGSKGVLTSAAAGGSLIAASLLLVVAVSALIGFRGFDSAREAPARQSVVIDSGEAQGREAGTAVKPAPVVIGGASRAAASRSRSDRGGTATKRKRSAKRRSAKREAGRSGLSAPVAGQPSSPVAAPEQPKDVPASAPVTAEKPDQKAPPAVTDAVGGVTKTVEDAAKQPVESVGDVLLDLRDVLP